MTVDFLPFANAASSANVVTQAEYLAAASGGYVQNGFSSGTAASNQANKAIRQSSVMVAALAQFIAAKLSADVLDSGGPTSVTALQAQFLAAIQAGPTFTGTPAAPTAAAGTNTTQLASTAFVTSAVAALIPSGTAMLFAQTSAPTGWTKSTAHNDKMLRIVSGAAGSGGSAALSTAWTSVSLSGTVAGHTLTSGEIPSHTHSGTTGGQSASHTHAYDHAASYVGGGGGVSVWYQNGSLSTGAASNDHTHNITTDGGTGGGGSHTHGITVNSFTVTPAYLDVIAATKN